MDFLIPILNMIALAIGVVAILVGLFSAPWQVLLIILLFGILTSRWLIHRSHLEGAIEDIGNLETLDTTQSFEPSPAQNSYAQSSPADQNTFLSYRGNNYKPRLLTPDKIAEISFPERSGRYRGVWWKTSNRASITETSGQYRGGKWNSYT